VALLSDQDRQTVARHLAVMTRPVKILFFTQTIGAPESVLVARQVLDELVSLSEQLSLEEVNLILDRDRAAQYGIEHVPAIVLLRPATALAAGGEEDTRIRFLGAPSGYEFMSLIEAVILAGTEDSGLTEASKNLIAAQVTGPLDIQVYVTPT
jgi:hypothetical protein